MAGKWHKNTAVETAGPAWEAQNTGCLHFCLLAQNFSFSWDFHSLLSPEGEEKKKKPAVSAVSAWRLRITAGFNFQVADTGKAEADAVP